MDGSVPALDVGHWAAHNLGTDFYGVHAVIAVHRAGQVVGAAILHDRTKYDMELSYYGPGSMNMATLRDIATTALDAGMLRLTIRIPETRRKMARFLTRIGCRFEGKIIDYYGPAKDAVLYAATYPLMTRLARRV